MLPLWETRKNSRAPVRIPWISCRISQRSILSLTYRTVLRIMTLHYKEPVLLLLLNEVCYLMNQDKTLTCRDCGAEFVFTASEQDFFAERGFTNEPQRCKPCRDARKNGGAPRREMFTVSCSACGGEARVPFQPRDDRPVYCSDCYSRQR